MHARRPGSAGHTAQAEQRDAFDVLAQPDPRGQPRLQCRHCKPGNRRRKDDVDLRRLDLRLVKRREKRLLSQVEGDFDVGIVCLGEAAQLAVSRQRQRGVAELNPTAESEPPEFRAGEVGQCADGFVLGVPVGGNFTATAATDGSAMAVCVFSPRDPELPPVTLSIY